MTIRYLVFIITCLVLNTFSATKWHIYREIIVPVHCITLDCLDFIHCQIFTVYLVYKVYEVYLAELFVPRVALGFTP